MDNPTINMPRFRVSPANAGKADGFADQRIVVLPGDVIERARQQPLLAGLLPTDAGYFPNAAGHIRRRAQGIDQAIFIYCVKGKGWCELQGSRHPVSAGELLVVPPEVPHAYGADAQEPWTIPWVHATGTHVPRLLQELGASAERPTLFLGEDPHLLALFEELLEVLEQGYGPSRLLYASNTLTHLIGSMIWHRALNWRDEPDAAQRTNQTIAYMKQHLEQPLRVAQLAALANLSSTHYATLFRVQTGYSPIDYLIRLRMQAACQLLDTTHFSIKHIAQQLGYEDQLYFSRVFHAVVELSPRDYRKTRKG